MWHRKSKRPMRDENKQRREVLQMEEVAIPKYSEFVGKQIRAACWSLVEKCSSVEISQVCASGGV